MYFERPSRVPGAFVWTSVCDGVTVRVLPDGCMDLLWDGEQIQIAGPDTEAFLYPRVAGAVMTGLRFAPGDAPLLLGSPAREFVNRRVPLDAVWSGGRVRALADRLSAAPDPGRVLELVAAPTFVEPKPSSALTATVVSHARAGTPVDAIAAATGLSARQLRRRCDDAFGYGPKLLQRILRMGRALELARGGARMADVAARCGYADQPHFTRDVKDFAGVALGQLVADAGSAANKSTVLPSGSRTTA